MLVTQEESISFDSPMEAEALPTAVQDCSPVHDIMTSCRKSDADCISSNPSGSADGLMLLLAACDTVEMSVRLDAASSRYCWRLQQAMLQ